MLSLVSQGLGQTLYPGCGSRVPLISCLLFDLPTPIVLKTKVSIWAPFLMAGILFATANMPSSCALPTSTCQGATYCSPLPPLLAKHLPAWTSSFYLLPKPLDSKFCHLFGLPSCWALLSQTVYFPGLALSHYIQFLVLTCTKKRSTLSLATTASFSFLWSMPSEIYGSK